MIKVPEEKMDNCKNISFLIYIWCICLYNAVKNNYNWLEIKWKQELNFHMYGENNAETKAIPIVLCLSSQCPCDMCPELIFMIVIALGWTGANI